MPSHTILLCTFGSLGDLHPFVAIAHALRLRGLRPVVATHAGHLPRLRAQGLDAVAVRPDLADHADDPQALRRVWHPWRGPDWLLRGVVLPALRDSHADLDAAAARASLVVSHPLTLAAPLVARARGLPWLSVAMAPAGLLSRTDPPLLPTGTRLPAWGLAALERLLLPLWSAPVRALRDELGLADTGEPLARGQFSPLGTLALFPQALTSARDLPPDTVFTGFPLHDDAGEGLGGGFGEQDADRLQDFLAAGTPPVVFTLGSAAVLDARDFYLQALAAARRLGRRSVLLTGAGGTARLAALGAMPGDDTLWLEYAPFSRLFPRAAAVVHQGGIGTCAQALRAGVPSLVVPFGFDQPDNAARLTRLGVARTLPRRRFQAARAASELNALLLDGHAARAATVLAPAMQADGARAAAQAIEAVLVAGARRRLAGT